jgi:hypothetical protein
VSNATDVIAEARRLRPEMESTAVWEVKSSVARAYRQARLATAEAKFLGNRGWTLADFKKLGAAQMSASAYASVDAQIAFFDFNADLIFAGYDKDDEGPSILTITNPGVCVDHTKLGFWCVGSGSTAAQMSLFERQYVWSLPAEDAAYYLYEAKHAAERATGVGKTTDIHLLKKGKNSPTIITLQAGTKALLEKTRRRLSPKTYTDKDRGLPSAANEFKINNTS